MTLLNETFSSGTTVVNDEINLKQHLNAPSAEGQTLRGSVEKRCATTSPIWKALRSPTCTTWCSPK